MKTKLFSFTFPNLQSEICIRDINFFGKNFEKLSGGCVWIEIIRHTTSQKIYLYGGQYYRGYLNCNGFKVKPIVNKTKLIIKPEHDTEIRILRHNPNKTFMYSLRIQSTNQECIELAKKTISEKLETYRKIKYLEKL